LVAFHLARSGKAMFLRFLAPGVYDAFSASITGSRRSIRSDTAGRCDIRFVSLTEMAQIAARICGCIDTPIVVDRDAGWGNAHAAPPKGDKVPQGIWKTITFVAALRHDKMVAPTVSTER
jgi:hypothetical protein